ncbi:hypothetical protein DY000_02018424 [Brassica cretica]|uniref:dolichyl-diphosphooligosaccharide--protein glycotransferase n=1 Tax=Brassica cretica TaxID=69181 RepID=A0ABQ7CNV8_BRACR|nr:hypothetical protein DY000_02018424 [Brassica cretica]
MATLESPPPGTPSAMRNAFGTVLSALILLLIGVLAFSIRLFSVFIIIHVVALVYYIKGILSPKMFKVAVTLVVSIGLVVCLIVVAVLVALVASSPTGGWSGRSLSLLDPTYASKYIPIIASVSEHQPPTWPSYFMDINVLAFLVPAGIIACFSPLSDASSFVVLYIVMSVYFSGVMVRLMLVLAPAACIMSGIALSQAFDVFTASIKYQLGRSSNSKDDAEDNTSTNKAPKDDSSSGKTDKGEEVAKERSSKKGKKKEREPADKPSVKSKIAKKRALVLPLEASIVALLLLIMLGAFYVIHCVWAAAEAYSAPSIVLTSQSRDGLHVFDDFRESYAWLSHNTDVDDKVASWWDYGYQTTAMANRTVIVDNNTWNNTHIATVGTAMSSPEKAAWEIFNSLDVKYVLVVFGGLIGYPSDDINKFLWMVRIGGGVFPHIKEADYLTLNMNLATINFFAKRDGNYRIDSEATPTMLNCLMYKLSYYRFVETDGKGYDRVRRTEIGKKNFKLTHFEEVFTSHHWMVRIYKLKPQKNRIRGRAKKLKLIHCVWAAAEAYSAPSIVLTSQSRDGLHVFDDFRESYAWLSHNTDVDDKVASWWDYGYQTTAMANRTVIVDNNTWNNTHIATVGTAMSSPEKAAWEIFNSLDVKYVLVVFGGLIGYPSDDINKFLWMVRIGGGVFPHIKEADYLRDGNYRIDSEATPTMLNCLMYKLSYYRFVETDGKGYDRVRRTEIGKKNFKLTHFEEVFTSHHWMVRIYKLKPQKNRIRGRAKKLKLKTSSGLDSKPAKKNPWI